MAVQTLGPPPCHLCGPIPGMLPAKCVSINNGGSMRGQWRINWWSMGSQWGVNGGSMGDQWVLNGEGVDGGVNGRSMGGQWGVVNDGSMGVGNRTTHVCMLNL